MRKARRYHAVRGLALAALLLVVTVTLLGIRNQIDERRKADYATGLVQRLLDANLTQVPAIIEEIAPTVVLLASDEGSYYTGSIVNISGGHLML